MAILADGDEATDAVIIAESGELAYPCWNRARRRRMIEWLGPIRSHPFTETSTMLACPHCGWTTHSGSTCERCFAGLQPAFSAPASQVADGRPSEVDWTTVARFGNAAEAGYFAHELAPLLNCEPRIEYRDDFDALGGSWRTHYALTVPPALAEHARRRLSSLLEGVCDHEADAIEAPSLTSSGGRVRDASTKTSGINWVPIMLTLAAGSAVLWAGKKAQVRRPAAPRDAGQLELWEILAEDADPWVQRRDNGRGLRELSIDVGAGTATIREDTDGDGLYDREVEILTRSQ